MNQVRQTKSGPWSRLHRACLKCGVSSSGTMVDLNNKQREKFALWDHYEHADGTQVQALFCFECGTINNVTISQVTGDRYQIMYLEDDDGCFHYKSTPSDLNDYFSQNTDDPDLRVFRQSRAFERMKIRGFLPSSKKPLITTKKKVNPKVAHSRNDSESTDLGKSIFKELTSAKRNDEQIQAEWRDRKTAILWICGLLSLSWIDGFDDAFTGLAKVLIGGVFMTGMSTVVLLEVLKSVDVPSWPATLGALSVCFGVMSLVIG